MIRHACAISCFEKRLDLKSRKYLERIIKGIQDAVQPNGPFKPDEVEIIAVRYGWEPHIPDIDFGGEAC